MRIRFVLVGEGSSDLALLPVVRRLVFEAGADDVGGDAVPCRTHDVAGRMGEAVAAVPTADLFVVHRDADREGWEARAREVEAAAAVVAPRGAVVACVPVRETEAWLLADEAAIRRVAGNPRGRLDLGLPSAPRVEAAGDPKRLLRDALVLATEATGRRRKDAARSFDAWRRVLLEELDPDGPVASIPSFARFRTDVAAAVEVLRGRA